MKGRLRRWFEDRLRERITLSGALYLGAMLMVGMAAFASANNLLFLLLAAMLATLMVSGFISRLGIASLELDIQLPEHICARSDTAARFVLRNEKRWFPSFSITVAGVEDSVLTRSLYFPVIPGHATLEETVNVRFARRGLHQEDSFQFSSRFPFGFAERRARVTMKRDVLIYPAIEPKAGFDELFLSIRGELESHFRGRGHDFYRIRPYHVGESARHVDWRATAHTGELQVREFAREQEPLVTLVLDAETADDNWFEQAVECAAWLAARLTQTGSLLRFRTQGFDVHVPLEGDLYAILKFLALARPKRGPLPAPDSNDDSVEVILTPQRERADASGWTRARVVDPRALADPRARP
jgi:uncharacterized protein (DUF58 family)